ncbi:MAG: SRPBCC domain-containing protein [Thermoanaerobaculia bacterium]|nr:SRPBCC domain-containing protein [Thermoanaerobaculia bacterium]
MPETLRYSVTIQAAPERVWEILLARPTYEAWTRPFSEGSTYEGTWAEGERIRFLGPGGDGMLSEVAAMRPAEFLSLHHIGEVRDGAEVLGLPDAGRCAGPFENYTLTRVGDGTELVVEVDVTAEFEAFMNEAFPKALAILRELCEGAAE